MSDSLRLVFAGTPEFAVPALEALARSPHHVLGALTRPDKPAGRGRPLTESAVKAAARVLGISVEQPPTLNDDAVTRLLSSFSPDVIVVAAYGLLLPPAILEVPRCGCINIHASLLPRWRGAAPIQRALLAGDTETGISIMHMEPGLDTGPVYARYPTPIDASDTGGSLHDRLAKLGAHAILEVLNRIVAGTAAAQSQTGTPTYAPKLQKSEAAVDWSRPASQLERQVRAFNPWPVAQTHWRGQQLRIWAARRVELEHDVAPGNVLGSVTAGLVVACGEGALALDIVQLPGRRPLTSGEFLRAHDLRGAQLG